MGTYRAVARISLGIAFGDRLPEEEARRYAEGDIVCVRLQETGTHNGEYRGLAPTGRKLSYSVAAFLRVAEGKIAEGWVVYDQLDFLDQLGVIKFQGFPDENK